PLRDVPHQPVPRAVGQRCDPTLEPRALQADRGVEVGGMDITRIQLDTTDIDVSTAAARVCRLLADRRLLQPVAVRPFQ
ncbi:MAG TPA: hypothetical protein VGD84_14465, partial [Pseudonocardiaceae bacterium]